MARLSRTPGRSGGGEAGARGGGDRERVVVEHGTDRRIVLQVQADEGDMLDAIEVRDEERWLQVLHGSHGGGGGDQGYRADIVQGVGGAGGGSTRAWIGGREGGEAMRVRGEYDGTSISSVGMGRVLGHPRSEGG